MPFTEKHLMDNSAVVIIDKKNSKQYRIFTTRNKYSFNEEVELEEDVWKDNPVYTFTILKHEKNFLPKEITSFLVSKGISKVMLYNYSGLYSYSGFSDYINTLIDKYNLPRDYYHLDMIIHEFSHFITQSEENNWVQSSVFDRSGAVYGCYNSFETQTIDEINSLRMALDYAWRGDLISSVKYSHMFINERDRRYRNLLNYLKLNCRELEDGGEKEEGISGFIGEDSVIDYMSEHEKALRDLIMSKIKYSKEEELFYELGSAQVHILKAILNKNEYSQAIKQMKKSTVHNSFRYWIELLSQRIE